AVRGPTATVDLGDLAGGHPGGFALAGRQAATVTLHHVDVVQLVAVSSDQLGQGVAADLGVDRHCPACGGGGPVERGGSPGIRTLLRSLAFHTSAVAARRLGTIEAEPVKG